MTDLAWTFVGLVGCAALVNWWGAARGDRKVIYVAKPATLALLVAAALALHPAHDGVRGWFVAGLVLSLAGDVFLMLPGNQFVAGLASFLLAHVAYVVGFSLEQHGPAWLVAVGLGLVAAAVAVVGRRIVGAVRAGDDPALVGPVIAYLVVISAMVVTSWGTAIGFAIAGAALFYASDATLAWNRFVRPLRHGDLAVMVTYHLGQAGLVLALAAGLPGVR